MKKFNPKTAELRKRAEEEHKQRSQETPPQIEPDTQFLVHELQVHQIELEMQNEELRHTQFEVEAGLERYTELYDFAPMGYFTLTREGVVEQVNLTGARLLEVERAHLVGRRLGLFIVDADQPAFNDFLKKVFEIQVNEACEVALRKEDSRPLSSMLSASQNTSDASQRVVRIEAMAAAYGQTCRAVMSDITERKRGEEAIVRLSLELEQRVVKRTAELANANRQLEEKITELEQAQKAMQSFSTRAEFLVQTAAILTAQPDLDSMLNSVCKEAAGILNVPMSTIYLYDEGRDELLMSACFGFPLDFQEHCQPLPRPLFEQVSAQLGAKRIGVFTISQEFHDLPNARLHIELGICTTLAVKIIHNQNLVGFMSVFSCEKAAYFNENDQALLLGLADQVAQAVVNIRLFEQVAAGRQRLRLLSKALIDLQETERRNLALELHDELGQALTGVKLTLDTIPELPQVEGEQLQRVTTMVSDLITRVRRMALDLRPSMLDDMGLLPALRWLFKSYYSQSGEVVSFISTGLEQRFSPSVEITAYRIIQQALNNILRHAGNKQVTVNAWVDKQALNLQIIDRGVGFDPASVLSKSESTDLSGMRERARLLGGELVIESAPGAGTTLSSRLPLSLNPEEK